MDGGERPADPTGWLTGRQGGFSGRRVTRPPCNFASKRATTTNANGFRPVTYGSRPGWCVLQSAHSPADRRRLFPVDAELHSRLCPRSMTATGGVESTSRQRLELLELSVVVRSGSNKGVRHPHVEHIHFPADYHYFNAKKNSMTLILTLTSTNTK